MCVFAGGLRSSHPRHCSPGHQECQHLPNEWRELSEAGRLRVRRKNQVSHNSTWGTPRVRRHASVHGTGGVHQGVHRGPWPSGGHLVRRVCRHRDGERKKALGGTRFQLSGNDHFLGVNDIFGALWDEFERKIFELHQSHALDTSCHRLQLKCFNEFWVCTISPLSRLNYVSSLASVHRL